MFVTLFFAKLYEKDRSLVYSNAGHNPPLLKRAGGPYAWLKVPPGFVLGGVEGIRYSQNTLQFNAGDTLYLYTDGVTEALNPGQALFSESRLEATLNAEAARNMDVARLLRHIKQAIDLFAAGAEQADDITMLGIEYKGRGPQ